MDQFINLALYDKKYGYYMKKNPLGKNADYITAPLISNLFGEMIAIWCIAYWENLGKPKKIIILELGPGDGSLCKNLLNTFKNFRDFYKCVDIKLVEKSEKLKKIQKIKIKDKKVKWIKTINSLNYGPVIFLGNEFFDSLPIKQIYKKKNLLFEKYIIISKNKKKITATYKKAKKSLVKNIIKLQLINKGSIIEYPTLAIKYLKIIAKKICKHNGALLTFDYGYTGKKNKGTLQSIKNHKYINILKDPGNADITHHINYNLFSKILKQNNLKVEKVVNQSEFLQKLGIIQRANLLSKKMNFNEKANMFFRLKRLLDFNQMGSLFKVMFAYKKGKKFSLGF
jgi:cyclopropane-fatty-acyl-phospholipid synthase